MTTVFHSLLMMIELIQTTQVDLEKDTIDVFYIYGHNPAFDKKNIKKLHTYFENCYQNNIKYENLYNKVVEEFYSSFSFLIDYEIETMVLRFLIPKDNVTDTVKKISDNKKSDSPNDAQYTDFVRKVCEDIKNELLKRDEYKDLYIDYAFYCALNMFVETMIFSMDTFNEISKLRLDNNDEKEFREKLIGDEKLFKKYILSLNWIFSFGPKKINFTLLHNFDSIEVNSIDQKNNQICVSYNLYNERLVDELEQKILKKINDTLPSYYEENKINTMQDIFKYESTTKFTEYLKSKGIEYKVEGEDKLESLAIIAFNAIVMFRSANRNINFIAKSEYYKDAIKACHDLKCSKQQYVLKENFEKKGIKINLDLLELDVLAMHKTEAIFDICRLSVSLEKKIGNIMNFADQYLNALIDRNKEKHGIAIKEFFEHLKDNKENEHKLGDIELAEEFCIAEYKKIKGLTKEIQDMKLAEKLKTYETNFFNQYNNDYKVINNKIVAILKSTKYTRNHVDDIYNETKSIMRWYMKIKPFFKTIIKIINLNRKIKNGKEKLVYNDLKTYKELENNNIVRKYITDIEIMLLTKEHNANKNEMGKTKMVKKLDKLEKLAYYKVNQIATKHIINANKFQIIDIVNDSILLKDLIVDAELYASHIIDSLLKNKYFK